ncbi:MAG: gephyrin-like molybdotransferase Glp [Phycisphaerae bacterium]
MIDIPEAYEVLFSNIQPGDTVEVPLSEALYRTLAGPIRCDVDYPPFDQSVMDGYAVRATDVAAAPVTLKIVGQIAAGTVPKKPLSPGETMQINTGAPIPPGADAVVCVEHTGPAPSGEDVLIRKAVKPGEFVTPRATYISAGQVVLEAGTRLMPVEIGAAASAGIDRVMVYRRPTVAVLSTGDELIEIDRKPTGAQIRNSNQYLLVALVTAAHAEPIVLGVARDNREAIREGIIEGLRSDVLCITGGVSMGAFDFVPEALEQCGAAFHIRKMAIKPGRPIIFATMPDGTLVFGLPGNPASALVGFELLVKPALAALEGRGRAVPPVVRATLQGSIKPTSDRRTFLPARARVKEDGEWAVETLSWHGSGDSFGMVTANALIMRPPAAGAVTTGDTVSMILLDRT